MLPRYLKVSDFDIIVQTVDSLTSVAAVRCIWFRLSDYECLAISRYFIVSQWQWECLTLDSHCVVIVVTDYFAVCYQSTVVHLL